MKNIKAATEFTCPRCGGTYTGYPALSRIDNSPICPDCGTREALESIGVQADEQDKILTIIHKAQK
jgi:transcription elongation factor Elf1